MNKSEAAEFLGVSVRAVERYTAAGKLAARYERGKTGQVLAFDKSDVQRFKTELETPQLKSTVESGAHAGGDEARQVPSRALARLGDGQAVDAAALMRAVYTLATMADKPRHAPTVPVESKLLLTLAEAQAMSGLSRAVLREAIDKKKLKARQIGRAFRVRRGDLEDFIKKLF